MSVRKARGARPAFHAGEVAIQRAMGVSERVGERGRQVIRDYLPDQHRAFFAGLRFINLGVLDSEGNPWAALRAGPVGFISSPDRITLEIASWPLPGEPLDLQLLVGAKVGAVGLELETRRRNRMNGTVARSRPGFFALTVDQSFGNCPRYIQRRTATLVDRHATKASACTCIDRALNAADIALIGRADTLFIASRSPKLGDDSRAGLDVNHRGGRPGFVKILRDETLVIPDYKGNQFFNTLGNISLDSRAGLQFLDFDTGDILSLTGRAEVVTSKGEQMDGIGTGRLLRFSANRIIRAKGVLPFRFCLIDDSPNLRGAAGQ